MVLSRTRTALIAIAFLGLASACGGGSPSSPETWFPTLTPHLYFSQDREFNGLYEIDLSTGTATLVGNGETGTTSSTIGLTETPDASFLFGSTFSDVARINADGSGAAVLPASAACEALAMNISTGNLYGGINGDFFSIDPATGVKLADLSTPAGAPDIEGLACDPLNDLVYGLVRNTGDLFVYDVATDTWRLVGNTGIAFLDPGRAYNHVNGVLYANDNTTDMIYSIAPSDATTTPIGPTGLGNSGGGLAFVLK